MNQIRTTGRDPGTVAEGIDQLSSASAKLVYVYLCTVGEQPVEDICASLDMGYLTAYSLLDTLSERGLVTKCDDGYTITPG